MDLLTIFYTFLVLFTLIVAYSYVSSSQAKTYYESRGVAYGGNTTFRMFVGIFKGVNMMDSITAQYNTMKAANEKIRASTTLGLTTIAIIDPVVLRSVFVKDFDHFADRRTSRDNSASKDILLTKALFFLMGRNWRLLRSKLTPAFTTGKIKRLIPLFDESGKKLVKFLANEISNGNGNEVDFMQAYSKYTMDIIATAVCGIDSGAFDQKGESKFEEMAAKLQIQFGGVQFLKMMIIITSAKLGELLGLSLFPKDATDFFSSAIKSSIAHRKGESAKRTDFLQLMLEARDNRLRVEEDELEAFEKDAILKEDTNKTSTSDEHVLDDDAVVANSVLFLLAGYDTTQSLLVFCAYALALNQDVQDKLRAEVERVLERRGGDIDYEASREMTYLDMVISETLRLYPPAGAADRKCTKDYKLPGTELIVKKGQGLLIPIYAMHVDPDYYPEPLKFNPERFSKENEDKINPYTYLPFGQGPRNCIGMRFALAEVKVAIAQLVYNFSIEPSNKTLIPMKYAKSASLKPDGGLFLGLTKIQH